jgi:FKBP-type peptidyl-prolyl cis-trans isomerase 2
MKDTKTYYYCNRDSYGQRTGSYTKIELSDDQIIMDGNYKYYGQHLLYEYEIECLYACQN